MERVNDELGLYTRPKTTALGQRVALPANFQLAQEVQLTTDGHRTVYEKLLLAYGQSHDQGRVWVGFNPQLVPPCIRPRIEDAALGVLKMRGYLEQVLAPDGKTIIYFPTEKMIVHIAAHWPMIAADT